MSRLYDASAFINGPLPEGIVRLPDGLPFGSMEAHVRGVIRAADARHADSAVGPVDVTGALFRDWIDRGRTNGKHSDAQAQRLVRGAKARIDAGRARSPVHADAGLALPSTALRMTQLGPDIMQPFQSAADLLDTIPSRSVQGDQLSYLRRFVIPGDGGGVTVLRGDQTSVNTVEVTYQEETRPLHWAAIGVVRGWFQQRMAAAAGVPIDAYKQDAVDQAFIQFQRSLILNGVAGLDCLSMATNPALLRIESSVVIGTATIAALHAEMVRVITMARALSPADLGPDTIILTDRIMFALLGTTALPTMGLNAWQDLQMMLSALGISRIVVGKSLRDYGGSGIDGMAVLRTGGISGMARVKGWDPAPVHTYQGPQGEVTIIAMSFGDLEQPVQDGSLVATFEVVGYPS